MVNKKIHSMYLRIVWLLLLGIQFCSLFSQSFSDKNIDDYLDSAKRDCLRYYPKDSSGIIGLPFPYYSPSPGKDAMFSELYYWDCFFTNRYGLLTTGKEDDLTMAKNQVDNFIYLVNRFGYVPNANRFSMLNRSQPPFLSLMVKDVFERIGDVNWLGTAVVVLEKEYQFWMQNRLDSFTLGVEPSAVDANIYKLDTLKQAAHWLAEAESGWDFTPRFSGRCEDFFPVDLNAILADYEKNLHWFYSQLLVFETNEIEKERMIQRISGLEKAIARREQAMKMLLWNKEKGVYCDFDKQRGMQSTRLTAASFFPVWLGMGITNRKSFRSKNNSKIDNKSAESLLRLLKDDCLMPLEKLEVFNYQTQWNYGNVWPPFQAIAVESIRTYFPEQYSFWASVISKSYCKKVELEFNRTGQLKEKYGIKDDVNKEEYATPAMMGWTSSVYRWLKITGY